MGGAVFEGALASGLGWGFVAQWCRNMAILKVGLAGALESYKKGASVWEERRFCRTGELGDTTVGPWSASDPTWQGSDCVCYTQQGRELPGEAL